MKLTITSRIGIILALVLVLTLSAMLITLLSQEESLKVEKAKENIHELTSNVKESIKYMMGEGVTDATPLVAKLASSKNILDLQVKEGDVIHPGASSAFDADERKCFETGNPLDKSEQFKNQNVFRTIEPIKAEGNCTQCHNATQGASLAVVSLRYSMKSTDEFIFSQRVKAAGMLITTILLTFIAIMLFLRKNVILLLIQAGAKIKELAGEIQGLTKNMNLLSRGHLDIEAGKKIDTLVSTHEDELGELASQVNIIIELVETTNASFVATRDEIAKLINETNTLTAFAKEGKLDERSDISKYTGAYRDLLDGINLSFAEIASPMQRSTQIINELAKGDFSVGMHGEYRGVNLVMKESINKLIDTMNHVFADIKSSLGATKSTANDISKMSENLVHDAHNQKSEIEEVASAIEEMSRTILGTTQNITNVSKLSTAAVDEAVRGDKKIGESKSGMLEASRLAGEAEQVINSLVKKTEQIGQITRVIDEISEQTNLLALNAAIEAARAGENGRGFAIVADEVRKLADRTGKATQEIAVTIKSIQVEAEKANLAMATAGQSVANGMNLTEELNTVLQKMSKAVSVVSDEMNQLAAAAEQQSATAEQICKNMSSISSVTDRFVSGTVEFDNTADQLRKLTDGLNDSISRFTVKNSENSGIIRR